ncbi:hypothetical protein MKW94_009303 [Papaver nudicaule]|uniref:Uncharacterized protein n=1 Tax=Papaver nudicaule TaxID=74823 RepID=A0AA41V885_PAPNU|nr:hypothetical protein [Papaver nudicaule]
MWVSQRENIPLNIKLFKEAPNRDNYTFKDDNDFTTEVLRHRIRLRYNGFRFTLSKHFRFNCGNDYDRALLNPPEDITNQEDWEFLCKHFSSDEFQESSQCTSPPHSNGPKSFSQTLHDRVLNGEPIDPVTMFEVTHEFKKCKDTTKCDEIKEKMKAMKDQVDSGELEMSLEEIYQMSISSTTTSSRKRRRGSDSTDYFSKTEEQMAAIQTKLDEANSARENQAKEIRRLKNKWENRENNMKLFLNQFLEGVGRDPLPPNAFDCEEEESET